MISEYHIVTRWQIEGTVEQIVEILADTESLPHWWPSVYLAAHQVEKGEANGVGRTVAMHTKGWFPYSIRWSSTLVEPISGEGFALTADGDLVGTGRWTFTTIGSDVHISFDWRVRAAKPLLRRLRWLLKPAFTANHRWAMRQGEDSLRLELRRRGTANAVGAERIPAPRGPTFRLLLRRASTPEMDGR